VGLTGAIAPLASELGGRQRDQLPTARTT
jgi:hypothetical protein